MCIPYLTLSACLSIFLHRDARWTSTSERRLCDIDVGSKTEMATSMYSKAGV